MKHTAFLFSIAIITLGFKPTAQAQSDAAIETVQPGYVNVHVTENSTREELAQLQKDLSAVNIGFRYDMVNWVDGKLRSIRFALILQDGTMVRNTYDAMDAETNIWIRLEGVGEERVFCAGSNCAE